MAIPVYTLVNTTGSPITLVNLGLTIPGSGTVDATGPDGDVTVSDLFNDPQLNSLVDAGTVTFNADAVVLTSEQSKVVIAPQRTGLAQILHNTTATTAPTVNEDEDDGYSVGSVWIDTTDVTVYTCGDASSGAAIWNWAGPRSYPNSTTDPVSPTPVAGDTYYNTTLNSLMRYDGVRGKWLSEDSVVIAASDQGSLNSGAYHQVGTLRMSATRGYYAMSNGTVVALGYTRSDSDSSSFDVTADGSTIANVASSSNEGGSITLDGDFDVGDRLATRNGGPNSQSNTIIWVRIKWRA